MPLFTRHSVLLQTAYSELKRRAGEQPLLLVGTPGSVGRRDVKGRPFLYRQFYDAQGKKAAEYIGPAGDEAAEERARIVREEIELTGALVKEARLLGQQGYVRVDSRTRSILASLAQHGLFRGGALLVGSHAYGALLNELGIRAAGFLTEDVDVARGKALDLPHAPDQGFEQMLADSTVPLRPVPNLDRKAPSTSFKAPGADRLRVDLLVPARGDEVSIRAVAELRAHATAVPHLSYVLRGALDTVVLGRDGVVPLRVPKPEMFAWHKMLVSQLRVATREKQGKDLEQASVLVAVLAEDAPDALREAHRGLPRGTRTKAREGGRRVLSRLEDTGHEKAAKLLGSLLR
jgi:hypothetical protein